MILAAAKIATAAFAHIPYCDTLEEALQEVGEALEPGKICLAVMDETGSMLGWIGGQHTYALVWELHPLVVDPFHQLICLLSKAGLRRHRPGARRQGIWQTGYSHV